MGFLTEGDDEDEDKGYLVGACIAVCILGCRGATTSIMWLLSTLKDLE